MVQQQQQQQQQQPQQRNTIPRKFFMSQS